MTRRVLLAVCYAMILVVVSEARTVWLALAHGERFIAYVPGVVGPYFLLFVSTSALAGSTVLLVAARIRWAVWLNIAVGLWSILLLQLIRAPQVNSLFVAIACAVTAGVPLMTWMRGARPAESQR